MAGLIAGTIGAIVLGFWAIGGAVLGGIVGAVLAYLMDKKAKQS